MRIEKFKAIVDEIEVERTSKNGRKSRNIVLKVPAPVDQFRGEKFGEDQYYRLFVSENTLAKITLPNKGDIVVISGFLNGERKLDNEYNYYYPLSMVLGEMEITK